MNGSKRLTQNFRKILELNCKQIWFEQKVKFAEFLCLAKILKICNLMNVFSSSDWTS